MFPKQPEGNILAELKPIIYVRLAGYGCFVTSQTKELKMCITEY